MRNNVEIGHGTCACAKLNPACENNRPEPVVLSYIYLIILPQTQAGCAGLPQTLGNQKRKVIQNQAVQREKHLKALLLVYFIVDFKVYFMVSSG